jgi:hypothetical protein
MKRAIFYIPGSSQHFFEQSGKIIADRIVRGLLASGKVPTPCRVANGDARKPTASAIPVAVSTIETRVGGQWQPVIDIIELQYLPTFTQYYDGQTSLGRAIHAAWVFAANIGRALRTIFNPEGARKDGWDRLQGAFTGWITLLSLGALIYWILVAATVVLGVGQIADLIQGEDAKKLFTWVASITAGLTIGGLAIKDFLGNLEKSAIEYYAIVDHLSGSNPPGKIENAILDLIEDITASGAYEKVDLLCFSLGAVIACDTMFPRRSRLPAPSAQISTLITIGYPYDIIATAYPGYFDRRFRRSITAGEWVNVDLENDFLGSNFRLDSQAGPPVLGITVDDKSAPSKEMIKPDRNIRFTPDAQQWRKGLLDFIPLTRTLNHMLYWDATDARARTCFEQIAGAAEWAQDFAVAAPVVPVVPSAA